MIDKTDLWARSWCGLDWTDWTPLRADAIRQFAARVPGVYRVRRVTELRRMTYIGQTARSLCERLLALARAMDAERPPYNDPHTAAPQLWLLQHLEGARFEFSCAAVVGDRALLHATEDLLLWRHRIELGMSTEANFGRFFPGWTRPTNRVLRSGAPGRSAAPLPRGTPTPDYERTEPALKGEGGILDAPWWERMPLPLAALRAPSTPGIYAVFDGSASTSEPLYIGETTSLVDRAAAHAADPWPVQGEPWLAFRALPHGMPKHVLRELESDLLGWHFWRTGLPPARQYLNSAGSKAKRAR